MECDTHREQISRWLDNQLAEDEIRELKVHTATCPNCQAALTSMRLVDQFLTSVPIMAPAPGFTSRFQTRLVARRRRHRTWAGLMILVFATMALFWGATAFLAVSGLALWENLASSGLLTQGVGLVLDLGKAVAASLKLVWLVFRSLAQGMRHPAFVAYAVATAILSAFWTQIVTRRALAHGSVPISP